MADPIITLEAVTKRFGSTAAVSDVSFQVMPGRCVGWLGPNGSGKTTLIRCMLGLARPTTGTITVRGHAVPGDVRQALTRVGAIVEEPRFYPYLTGKANLEVAAKFVGGEAITRVDWALERVDLTERGGSKVKEYSLGMRQRLGLARSLLNDPELLILDEPSNGLDPAGIVEFREMIRSFVEQEGRTVFISSHLLDEVQKIADDIAIVQSGKLVLHGSVEQLVAEGRQSLRVRVDDPGRAESELLSRGLVRGVSLVESGVLELDVDRLDDQRSIDVTRALVEAGVGVIEVVRERESLEERFLEITGGLTADTTEEGST